MRQEAAVIPDILYLFGQGKFFLSGISQGILKNYGSCGNH